jgi:aquaporin Z
MKKEIAEFIGTFTLVLFGCGAAAIAGDSVGVLGISFAFGLALIAMAYGIGSISGCHINPAVSFAAFLSGRISFTDFIRYSISQILGAIAAAFVLMTILKGRMEGYDVAGSGLGQNGWGAGYLGEYTMMAALIFEIVATFLFVLVILGATDQNGHGAMAGLAIGLTLVVIHIVGINITGVSVNPARSIGPAIFVGGEALQQVWLFIVGPMVGGAIAAIVHKNMLCADACPKSE